jgi:hypothetical protein
VDGARVLVLLDETQRLSIDASAAAVDGRILRIAIWGGNWQWTSYGASDRHEQLLDEGVVEFHAPYHR